MRRRSNSRSGGFERYTLSTSWPQEIPEETTSRERRTPLDRFCWAEQKQLTADVGLCNATVSRWLTQTASLDKPTVDLLIFFFNFSFPTHWIKFFSPSVCCLSDQFYFVAVSDRTVFPVRSRRQFPRSKATLGKDFFRCASSQEFLRLIIFPNRNGMISESIAESIRK